MEKMKLRGYLLAGWRPTLMKLSKCSEMAQQSGKRENRTEAIRCYNKVVYEIFAAKEEMIMAVREGFHTVTPYLVVRGVPQLIEFLQQAFGATEHFRSTGSAGGLHVEVKIGDSMVM